MKLSTLATGKAFKRFFLAAAVATCASSAYAALPKFTFDPTVLCPNSTCTASEFIADNVIVSDYATVTTASNGTFAESGYLQVTSFQLGKKNFMPVGLNEVGGYSLYISFATTGHTTGVYSTGLSEGVLDTLSYSFIGAPGAVSGDTANPGQVVLASGSLIDGTTTLKVSGKSLIPGANVNVTFNPVVNTFFRSPVPFYDIAISSFTNTPSEVIAFPGGFTVDQGGGSLNFAARAEIPEPSTLALLGVGLLGFAMRKRK